MREPDRVGAGRWRAWLVQVEPRTLDHRATVANWLLYCPGAHTLWHYWWIALIHLRPIEGVRPAVITSPGAGWEMLCCAQNPSVEPDPDRPYETFSPLRPIDWVVQFGVVADDRAAARVLDAVIDAIMAGTASPDSDFRSFWKRTIPGTAQCIADGHHPEH